MYFVRGGGTNVGVRRGNEKKWREKSWDTVGEETRRGPFPATAQWSHSGCVSFVFICSGEVYPSCPCFTELSLCVIGLMNKVFHDLCLVDAIEPFLYGRWFGGAPFGRYAQSRCVH